MVRRAQRVCLSCGEVGTHARELCKLCYDRARNQDTLHTYPDCGAVPVPYRGWGGPVFAEQPAIPRHYLDPYMLGNTRDQHAVMAGGWDWVAVVNAAELFAASWLAARTLAAA